MTEVHLNFLNEKSERIKRLTTVAEARAGIEEWMRFYNADRTHQSLDRQTPEEVYFNQPTEKLVA